MGGDAKTIRSLAIRLPPRASVDAFFVEFWLYGYHPCLGPPGLPVSGILTGTDFCDPPALSMAMRSPPLSSI